jgi:hypothetical protein
MSNRPVLSLPYWVIGSPLSLSFCNLLLHCAYAYKQEGDAWLDRLARWLTALLNYLVQGGMPGSVNLRDCKVLEKMVKKHDENGGLYGAICAAPAVTLADWGMLKGLKVQH